MIPECLSKILGQTWKELITQAINFGHFFIFVVQTNPLAVQGYYMLSLLVYKATLPIFWREGFIIAFWLENLMIQTKLVWLASFTLSVWPKSATCRLYLVKLWVKTKTKGHQEL